MKYSVEKDIARYPAGVKTDRPPQTASGVDYFQYDLGGGLYVWRTNNQSVEVGKRGGGGTYYVKVNGHILEGTFTTLRGAMRVGVKIGGLYVDGQWSDTQRHAA